MHVLSLFRDTLLSICNIFNMIEDCQSVSQSVSQPVIKKASTHFTVAKNDDVHASFNQIISQSSTSIYFCNPSINRSADHSVIHPLPTFIPYTDRSNIFFRFWLVPTQLSQSAISSPEIQQVVESSGKHPVNHSSHAPTWEINIPGECNSECVT